jgi:hypothetical protein
MHQRESMVAAQLPHNGLPGVACPFWFPRQPPCHILTSVGRTGACYLQLRVVLEDSHAALEDARGGGVAIATGSETGVYVACISFEYATVLERGGFKVASMLSDMSYCPAASLGNLLCCD